MTSPPQNTEKAQHLAVIRVIPAVPTESSPSDWKLECDVEIETSTDAHDVTGGIRGKISCAAQIALGMASKDGLHGSGVYIAHAEGDALPTIVSRIQRLKHISQANSDPALSTHVVSESRSGICIRRFVHGDSAQVRALFRAGMSAEDPTRKLPSHAAHTERCLEVGRLVEQCAVIQIISAPGSQ